MRPPTPRPREWAAGRYAAGPLPWRRSSLPSLLPPSLEAPVRRGLCAASRAGVSPNLGFGGDASLWVMRAVHSGAWGSKHSTYQTWPGPHPLPSGLQGHRNREEWSFRDSLGLWVFEQEPSCQWGGGRARTPKGLRPTQGPPAALPRGTCPHSSHDTVVPKDLHVPILRRHPLPT